MVVAVIPPLALTKPMELIVDVLIVVALIDDVLLVEQLILIKLLFIELIEFDITSVEYIFCPVIVGALIPLVNDPVAP